MTPFPLTSSTVHSVLDLLESEERTLEERCRLMTDLLNGAHPDSEQLSTGELDPATTVRVHSNGRVFEYNSLDEILSRVVAEEDLYAVIADERRTKDGAKGRLEDAVKSVDPALFDGLRKIRQYYEFRKQRKRQNQNALNFLSEMSTMNEMVKSRLSTDFVLPAAQQLPPSEPNRFESPVTPKATEPEEDLMELVQKIVSHSLFSDLSHLDVSDPEKLPSLLRTANLLSNLERPKRLIFMKNE